ncbi:MAG: hypothetical protein Q3980_14940 [Turicibacter sp.]|nr:hypothetical protein [Turicibacter sp.]MDO5793935.1 hypothetical protein [Turicibacter sp.]
MNNEKGIIMPLTLVISLIIATLLLHFAHRLENQVRTYELQRYHLILTLLEKECLSFITTELTDPNFTSSSDMSTKTIVLHNGTTATITYKNGYQNLDVTYKFLYNEYLGQGTIEYNKKNQTYLLK